MCTGFFFDVFGVFVVSRLAVVSVWYAVTVGGA